MAAASPPPPPAACWDGQGPPDDRTCGFPHPVIVGAVDVAGHAKVPDLHHQAVADQAVAGGQVPVDKVQRGQVHHPGGDLGGDLQHLAEGQLAKGRVTPTVVQDLGVWPVGPARRGGEGMVGLGSALACSFLVVLGC